MVFGVAAEVVVIGEYAAEIARELSRFPAQDKVVKAMLLLGDKEGHAGAVASTGDAGVHA